MEGRLTPHLNRREVIAASATVLIVDSEVARAALIKGGLPFRSGGTNPPEGAEPGPWRFFTPEEGTTVEAIVDRLIPADELTREARTRLRRLHRSPARRPVRT